MEARRPRPTEEMVTLADGRSFTQFNWRRISGAIDIVLAHPPKSEPEPRPELTQREYSQLPLLPKEGVVFEAVKQGV